MSIGQKFSRGDVVLVPISFVIGSGQKTGPAVVIQNDNLNARLQSTLVAIITSTTTRAASEPTQLLIDVSTPEGRATGLLHPSTVKCEHLDTVNQLAIQRRIGQFSQALMDQLEVCLKKAMDIS